MRNEWHPDVQTAISRLSPEELSNRNKRLKRAMDLSLKHSELSKEAQAAVQPLVGYLPLERAREERLERLEGMMATMAAELGQKDEQIEFLKMANHQLQAQMAAFQAIHSMIDGFCIAYETAHAFRWHTRP